MRPLDSPALTPVPSHRLTPPQITSEEVSRKLKLPRALVRRNSKGSSPFA